MSKSSEGVCEGEEKVRRWQRRKVKRKEEERRFIFFFKRGEGDLGFLECLFVWKLIGGVPTA